MKLEFGKDDEVIHITAGKEFIIVLDANPTTGYEWTLLFDESLVQLVDREFKPPSVDLIGAGGQERFTFEPRIVGETTIKMQMKRPWEETAVEEHVFLVQILGA